MDLTRKTMQEGEVHVRAAKNPEDMSMDKPADAANVETVKANAVVEGLPKAVERKESARWVLYS